MRKAAASQAALERRLGLVEAHQREVHTSLTGMEAAAARAYSDERGSLDDGGRERDGLYARAEALGASLARAGDDLRAAVADVNAGALAAGGGGGGAGAPMGKLVRVLNSQLQA